MTYKLKPGLGRIASPVRLIFPDYTESFSSGEETCKAVFDKNWIVMENLQDHRQVLVALNGDYTGDPNLIFLDAECYICSALFLFLAYLAVFGTQNYHSIIFFTHKHEVRHI